MKIIRPGKVVEIILAGECSACGCQLECTPTEATPNQRHDIADPTHSIHCPTVGCRKIMHLRPKILPPRGGSGTPPRIET